MFQAGSRRWRRLIPAGGIALLALFAFAYGVGVGVWHWPPFALLKKLKPPPSDALLNQTRTTEAGAIARLARREAGLSKSEQARFAREFVYDHSLHAIDEEHAQYAWDTHIKMACGDPKAAPKAAILDPVLTLTQPRAVAAATGMDALAHAVESAVTRNRNRLSQMFSREAFRLGAGGLRRVLAGPNDLEARGPVLLGAALAGMAIENSMLGAAHAAANPLTARFGIVHGQAVGLLIPAVVRF